MSCMSVNAHTVSCLGRGDRNVLEDLVCRLFARLAAGMRWGAQTAGLAARVADV